MIDETPMAGAAGGKGVGGEAVAPGAAGSVAEKTGIIAADLPCAFCGYDLRLLDAAGDCPECGRPIARTLERELSRSDPTWLRRQSWTALLLVAVCLINYRPITHPGGFSTIAIYLTMLLNAAVAAVAAWGCWRVGEVDPAVGQSESEGKIARGLRATSIGVAAYMVLSLGYGALSRAGALWPLVSMAGFACVVATDWLVALWLRDLATRSGDRWLLLHARVVLWALPLAQVGNLGWFAGSAATPGASEAVATALFTMASALSWALSLAVYAAVALLGRAHEVLRRAARAAEARALAGGRPGSAPVPVSVVPVSGDATGPGSAPGEP